MKLIIGLVGKICAGKGEVVKHMTDKHSASMYRFSDVLKDLLGRLHLSDTRENLQNLGVAIRDALSDGILADTLKEDIAADDKADIVVVDGIRYENEVDMLRSFENNVLVFVTAPDETRYERAFGRGTRGEKDISPEEFRMRDENETEKRVDSIGKQADITIDNSGTLEELYSKVDSIVEERLSQS